MVIFLSTFYNSRIVLFVTKMLHQFRESVSRKTNLHKENKILFAFSLYTILKELFFKIIVSFSLSHWELIQRIPELRDCVDRSGLEKEPLLVFKFSVAPSAILMF